MDRLTERNEHGEAYYKKCYTYPCDRTGEDCDNCSLIDIDVCEALAAYEDTGITPDQMREISRLYQKKCEELIACQRNEHNNGWIPCSEPPKDDRYVLLSFENFGVPMVGRYEEDENGGSYYIGDETEPCISQNIFVDAWRPLPKRYHLFFLPKGE